MGHRRGYKPTKGFDMWRPVRVAIALGILIVTVIFMMRASHAAENTPGQYDSVPDNVRSWFKGVRSPHGVPCCDIADGHRVQEDIRGERYWVYIEGDWHEVPPEAVVYNAGNPVGEPVVWYVRQGPDALYIRCFVPGGGV